ncbi:MAG: Fe-S cluster assembly scaffold protein NifU [Candidatus Thorarchaeota archaeon]|nr:MAG: Fe-S cluster assembly scaffold protein NifU [Candidatus Thorarchaeota archaeon]RLI57547.1 MAG: Fe-S cluster assembly scaffold protein NifU [Candidatus Thorarchaeota archaeon]
MKSTKYSEKVLDHFRNPRNVGTLEGPDVVVGRVGNPVCGDQMELYIRIDGDRITDAKFRTFGCGSAIATTSMTTEMVKGMTLEDAMKLTRTDVAEELDGLPPIKMHCSNLAADALHEAIKNYRKGMGEIVEDEKDAETEGPECVIGKDDFVGKGVWTSVDDYGEFKDLRTLIVHSGDESVELALTLTDHIERVVLLTPDTRIMTTPELEKQLDESRVKVLAESRLLEIRGEFEVEKVLIHNIDEDDDYELFVDAVVILE